MVNEDMRTDETLDLEWVVLFVLGANPTVPTYEEFRRLFADYLTTRCFYDEFDLEYALKKLDRGDLEFPKGILFTPPAATPAPAMTTGETGTSRRVLNDEAVGLRSPKA